MKKIRKYKNPLLIFSLFIFLSLFFCNLASKDSDFFWHIKAGEYMVNNGILTKDVFSWSVFGKYWICHEWLFEVIIYILRMLLGNVGLFLYLFISLLSLFTVFYLYNKKKIEKNFIFTIIWLVLSVVFIPFMQIRPHFVSFVFVSLTLYFIYDLINNKESKKIYILPLLTILWANLHGGSSNLGYLLCFFVLFFGIFKFKYTKIEANRLSKIQMKKLLISGILSILFTGINIHGFKMTIYPYQNMLDTIMVSNIAEWSPTNINNLSHLLFYILGFIILVILLISKKRISFIDFMLYSLGLFLGLKSIRFWPYLYIISSYFIFDYIESYKFSYSTLIIIFFDIILFIFCIFNPCKIFDADYKYLDEKMINKIIEVKPKRLFNYYNLGGELIYYNIPVFIDGRADLYSNNNLLSSYFSMEKLENDYIEQLAKYNFDYFLVEDKTKINSYCRKEEKLEKVFESNSIVLYKNRAIN